MSETIYTKGIDIYWISVFIIYISDIYLTFLDRNVFKMLDAINMKQIDFYESFIITTAVSIILENYLLCFTFTQICRH